MTDDKERATANNDNDFDENMPEGRPPLSPQAKRALAEAKERRAQIDKVAEELPKEIGGRGGTEPVRYGDWEVKGITSDF